MISIQVKTNTARKVKNAEITATPAQIINELGISPSGAMINLNGTILSATDLQATFADLGVQDGAKVDLNLIVKADGANK